LRGFAPIHDRRLGKEDILQLSPSKLIPGLSCPLLGGEKIELIGEEAKQVAHVGAGWFPLPPVICRAVFPTRHQRSIDHPVIVDGAGLCQFIQRMDKRCLAQVSPVTECFELFAKFFEIHLIAVSSYLHLALYENRGLISLDSVWKNYGFHHNRSIANEIEAYSPRA
ncbi:MAG: hypothetical protein KDE46_25610, partial [Caldilineaceae bacterium]|nr:hypothetical protein [Caldilineaceae bacterium]